MGLFGRDAMSDLSEFPRASMSPHPELLPLIWPTCQRRRASAVHGCDARIKRPTHTPDLDIAATRLVRADEMADYEKPAADANELHWD